MVSDVAYARARMVEPDWAGGVRVLQAEVVMLRAAIRAHRDQRGDDRCWFDDETLYAVLPEGYVPPARDVRVELENCTRFIMLRNNNPATTYVSPQRAIDRLSRAVDAVRAYAETLRDSTGWTDDSIPESVGDRIVALIEGAGE